MVGRKKGKKTATVAPLSEGIHCCDRCKERIDDLAVWVTRKNPRNRVVGFDLLGLYHRGCYHGEIS